MKLKVIDNHRSRFEQVPNGWQQRKMAAVVRHYQTSKNTDENPTVLSLTKHGLKVKSDLAFGKSTESYIGHQIVEKGQFVFTPRDFDATPILCGVASEGGCISNLYIVFDVVPDVIPQYLEYYFWGLKHGYSFFEKLSFGMRYSFNRQQFENIPFLYPDLTTQRQIADFLDRETARIDALIEKKQRLVGNLKSKITDFADLLVTGHDDPKREMKSVDSPWLGSIPKEWSVKKGKHLFRQMDRQPQGEDGVITSFRDGQVCLRSRRRTEGFTFAVLEVGYQRILKGDLVIHSMDAFAGAIGVSEDTGKATGEYVVCTPWTNEANSQYYSHLLRCMARREYIFVICPSVRERAPRFRYVRFAPLKLPVPPRAEQDKIVERIEAETEKLNKVRLKTVESIDRLKEYRSALITAAVTGQIDVTQYNRSGSVERTLDAMEQGDMS